MKTKIPIHIVLDLIDPKMHTLDVSGRLHPTFSIGTKSNESGKIGRSRQGSPEVRELFESLKLPDLSGLAGQRKAKTTRLNNPFIVLTEPGQLTIRL